MNEGRTGSRSAGMHFNEEPYGVGSIERLLHAANYQYGWTLELLIDGIRVVAEAGRDKIQLADLAEAYCLRKDCEPSQNPFLATIWQMIDTKYFRDPSEADSHAKVRGKRGSS